MRRDQTRLFLLPQPASLLVDVQHVVVQEPVQDGGVAGHNVATSVILEEGLVVLTGKRLPQNYRGSNQDKGVSVILSVWRLLGSLLDETRGRSYSDRRDLHSSWQAQKGKAVLPE